MTWYFATKERHDGIDPTPEFRAEAVGVPLASVLPRKQVAANFGVGFSPPSQRVVCTLNQIIAWRGKPLAIRVDNGPEYVSGRLQKWAEKARIGLIYIQPGKPQQNTYVERYNRTVRTEWLGRHHFYSIKDVREYAT